MAGKKPWKSKTLWLNLILGISSCFPEAQDWIATNPQTFGLGVTLLNLGLRAATGEAVSWKLIDKKL